MKRFLFSVILLLIICFTYKSSSYADNDVRMFEMDSYWGSPDSVSGYMVYHTEFHCNGNARYCFYTGTGTPELYSNMSYSVNAYTSVTDLINPHTSTYTTVINFTSAGYGVYRQSNNQPIGSYNFYMSIPSSSTLSDVVNYLTDDVPIETPYDSSLNLDSFTVYDYQDQDLLDGNIVPKYTAVWKCTWSDSDISFVKVRVTSTNGVSDYIGSGSPYVDSVNPATFANQNGDTITFIATPYAADGSYGNSLYCRFTYHDNSPLSNLFRKFVKTKNFDNTITIPYNGTDKKYDVDGITTTNVYKVNYNPVTNNYDNSQLYQIYYAPVIIYPYETPEEEIDDTQDVINNNYVTNNYYETTNNINYSFDFDFGDISGSDITDTYDEVGTYFDGLGGLLGKLVELLIALFPFLSPSVAAVILVGFGIVVAVAVIAFVLKIAAIIADIIPF